MRCSILTLIFISLTSCGNRIVTIDNIPKSYLGKFQQTSDEIILGNHKSSYYSLTQDSFSFKMYLPDEEPGNDYNYFEYLISKVQQDDFGNITLWCYNEGFPEDFYFFNIVNKNNFFYLKQSLPITSDYIRNIEKGKFYEIK